MKNAVVTGASTGIGYATVQKLLDDGWRVFGSVRTKADAKKLSSAFGERFVPLVFDVTDEKAITKAVASVRKMLDGKTLDGLVNNAGIALSDPLLMQSTDDFRQQLEVNVVGTFAVSKLFAPLLGADPSLTGAKGRIVNISSTAGKVGLPFLGGYVASKHAVEGLSDSMRRELLVHGIDVIVVEPGFVVTPIWDKAEEALLSATRAAGIEPELNPGEGAFYGPKLEFVLTDAIGRDWQCGTHQVDFVLPERLDASYIGADGDKHRPVMLHRATLGSFERFIGILIESHAGKLPFWIAPRQVVVASIISDADDYVYEVVAALNAVGVRAEADIRNEKINYKVREHSVGKVPVILAVGAREVEERTVTVRRLGEKQTKVEALDSVISALSLEATPPDKL